MSANDIAESVHWRTRTCKTTPFTIQPQPQGALQRTHSMLHTNNTTVLLFWNGIWDCGTQYFHDTINEPSINVTPALWHNGEVQPPTSQRFVLKKQNPATREGAPTLHRFVFNCIFFAPTSHVFVFNYIFDRFNYDFLCKPKWRDA